MWTSPRGAGRRCRYALPGAAWFSLRCWISMHSLKDMYVRLNGDSKLSVCFYVLAMWWTANLTRIHSASRQMTSEIDWERNNPLRKLLAVWLNGWMEILKRILDGYEHESQYVPQRLLCDKPLLFQYHTGYATVWPSIWHPPSTGRIYIDRCVPFHIGCTQLSCWNISLIFNRMRQSSIIAL